MKKENNEPEVLETAEELQKEISALQTKLAVAEAQEDEDALEPIDLPVAEAMVWITKGMAFKKENLTPPEVLILTAMHNKAVGGLVVRDIIPMGTVSIDPIQEKNRLRGLYGNELVERIFPGVDFKMPMKFKRAIMMGLGTTVGKGNLFDFHVKPFNTGAE